jgi:hypothetical protein
MRAQDIQAGGTRLERWVLVGLTVLGMAICTAGIGRVAASGAWLGVPGILGSVLGVAVLAIVGSRLLGVKLPYLATNRQAIVAVLALAILKLAIAAAML